MKLNKKELDKANKEYMEKLYYLDVKSLAKFYSDDLSRRIKRGIAEAKRRKNEQNK
jgi:hypothetical protein